MQVRLTRRQAASIAVAAQLLAGRSRMRSTIQDIRSIIDRIAVIQIDTIHVVARSQYIIPWSRAGAYDPGWLDSIHYPDRGLFEYWGHAASLLDSRLLPCFLSRMSERRQMYHSDHYQWTRENLDLINQVRHHIIEHGPTTSLAFERPNPDEPVEPWAWYGGKPTNRVFDYLWLTGEIAVRRRINFRREYDLMERVFPEITGIEAPDVRTERRTLADRALLAMGIARPEWLNDYFRTKWGIRTNQPPGPQELLDELVSLERAVPVEIEGLGSAYLSSEHLDLLDDVIHGFAPTRTTLLSPFDNLIWDRQRTTELFDFDYRIECYTPEAKRIYGYFTLPILRRGRLVGRLDPKVDRKTGQFLVKALHLEPGTRLSRRMIEDIAGAVRDFALWNGADHIVCTSTPVALCDELNGPILARKNQRRAPVVVERSDSE